jgi:hypothetical protein
MYNNRKKITYVHIHIDLYNLYYIGIHYVNVLYVIHIEIYFMLMYYITFRI